MKSAIPGEIVDTGRCFEKNNRRTAGGWGFAHHTSGNTGNLAIIESTDDPALDALVEKLFHQGLPVIIFFIS